MKDSIDLTENQAFQNNSIKRTSAKYPHRTLPWERADVLDSAKRKFDNHFNQFNYSITDTTNNYTWSVRFDNSVNNNLTTNVSVSMNVYENDTYTDSFYNIQSEFGSVDNTWTLSQDNYSYTIHMNEDILKSIFPTGHRDYIKLHRKKEIFEYEKVEKSKCKICGKTLLKLPWYKKEDYLLFNMCEKHFKECNEEKSLHKRMRWYSKKVTNYIRTKNDMFVTVPCISRRLPKEKLKRIFPKRYKCWEEIYDPIYRPRNKVIKDNAVYYKKYKQKYFRGGPWQPKGRVDQVYDDIFDKINWREMLINRVLLLDSSK